MKVKKTIEIEVEMEVQPCILCGSDKIDMYHQGDSSFNLGGGRCLACRHEIVDDCNCNPHLGDLIDIWNSKNDADLLLKHAIGERDEMNARIASLEKIVELRKK